MIFIIVIINVILIIIIIVIVNIVIVVIIIIILHLQRHNKSTNAYDIKLSPKLYLPLIYIFATTPKDVCTHTHTHTDIYYIYIYIHIHIYWIQLSKILLCMENESIEACVDAKFRFALAHKMSCIQFLNLVKDYSKYFC